MDALNVPYRIFAGREKPQGKKSGKAKKESMVNTV